MNVRVSLCIYKTIHPIAIKLLEVVEHTSGKAFGLVAKKLQKQNIYNIYITFEYVRDFLFFFSLHSGLALAHALPQYSGQIS